MKERGDSLLLKHILNKTRIIKRDKLDWQSEIGMISNNGLTK